MFVERFLGEESVKSAAPFFLVTGQTLVTWVHRVHEVHHVFVDVTFTRVYDFPIKYRLSHLDSVLLAKTIQIKQ